MTLKIKPFKKFVEKGENTCNQPFFLFPQYFYTITEKLYHLSHTAMLSANAFNLVKDKVMLLWKNLDLLTLSQTTNFTTFQIERVCRRQF